MNKAIVLELAKQIASVGGDPQDALKSGTFAPGTIGDPTAKGNSCDDANDPKGCIFTQNLLVEDATAAEISAAVAGVSSGAAATSAAAVTASASYVLRGEIMMSRTDILFSRAVDATATCAPRKCRFYFALNFAPRIRFHPAPS